jgi:hypothetical protein
MLFLILASFEDNFEAADQCIALQRLHCTLFVLPSGASQTVRRDSPPARPFVILRRHPLRLTFLGATFLVDPWLLVVSEGQLQETPPPTNLHDIDHHHRQHSLAFSRVA